MRFRLSYFDQNVNLKPLLPKDGTIARWVQSRDNQRWALFQLDNPLDYNDLRCGFLLLRSRWSGREIGDKSDTSVFIVLVPDGNSIAEGFQLNRDMFVGWGMVSPLA